jgi:hypothetical protein
MAGPRVSEDPDIEGCPLIATHDKCEESHYFLERSLKQYHRPKQFRWNLNAFLQSLRSVTLYLQKEMSDVAGFAGFYSVEQDLMRGDKLLRSFVEHRDIVVHQTTLALESSADAGLFRGRELKLAVSGIRIDPNEPSESLLRQAIPLVVGLWVSEDHSAIDEQVGVRRTWTVSEIGEGDVIVHCDLAWSRIEGVVARAHKLLQRKSAVPPEAGHHGTGYNILLESDVDSSLPSLWGWEDQDFVFDRRTARSMKRT